MRVRSKLGAITLGLGIALYAGNALADETVDVVLWDNPNMAMMMDMAVGMTGDHTMASMGITTSTSTVKAGEITFTVRNDSAALIHEMVIVPLTAADAAPPYDATMLAIDEEAAGAIGEVPELEPGQAGTASFVLTPGLYLLVCNIPGHYAGGMWTVLTVQP